MIRPAIIATALALAPAGAIAQDASPTDRDFCAPLRAPEALATIQAQLAGSEQARIVQSGLRSIFGPEGGLLADGIVGPVTAQALADLCEITPLAGIEDPVAGTIALSSDYADLYAIDPLWKSGILGAGLLAPAPTAGFVRNGIRLAGSPAMAATALSEDASLGACTDLDVSTWADDERDRATLAVSALLAIDPDLAGDPQSGTGSTAALQASAVALCRLYPVAGTQATFRAGLEDLAGLVETRPDALTLLSDPNFTEWLEAERVARLPRLVGTPPAVLALLADFDAQQPPPAAPVTPPLPSPAPPPSEAALCPPPRGATSLTHFALSQADTAALAARGDVAALLDPLLGQRFDEVSAMAAAIAGALAIPPASCAATRVQAVLKRRSDEAQVWTLDQQAVQNLALQPGVGPLDAALEDLVGSEARSEEALRTGLQQSLSREAGSAAQDAADAAAQAAAQAAEDVSPAPDTPAPGFPTVEPVEVPSQFALTDQSLLVLRGEIEDDAIFQAIADTPYTIAESRDLIAAFIADALAGVVDDQSAEATQAALQAVAAEGAIVKRQRITPGIVQDLAADPIFAALTSVPAPALEDLAGLEYPFEPLFEAAIEAAASDATPADRAGILGEARRYIPDGPRQTGPIAEDCGCVSPRGENALVYAFYPFWQSGLSAPPAAADMGASGDASPDAEAAARASAVAQVDFELVERIAFDGLAIDGDGVLQNRARWLEAAPYFVHSAHMHHAQADVAVRLSQWQDWTDEEISQIIDALLGLLEPVVFPDDTRQLQLARWLDGFLDPTPDGLTLVLDPADNGTDDDNVGRLTELVARLSERLPDPDIAINLAFDLDLSEGAQNSQIALLQALAPILPGAQRPRVDKLLVFLERPTSDTKKRLREEVERAFSGRARIEVLRSILPVVPPGGHATITSSTSQQPFSQFEDDILYFQDNFAGVAFWPAPQRDATDPVRTTVMQLFAPQTGLARQASAMGSAFAPVRAALEPVCSVTCPQRLIVYFVMACLLGTILILSTLSLYSGAVHRLAMGFFVLPVLVLLLLGLLLLTEACDNPRGNWALLSFLSLAAALFALAAYQWFQRRLDGPLP